MNRELTPLRRMGTAALSACWMGLAHFQSLLSETERSLPGVMLSRPGSMSHPQSRTGNPNLQANN